MKKWECKKLDSDNSFRIGVEISELYTPIISKIIKIFSNILEIDKQLLGINSNIKECIDKLRHRNKMCKTLLLTGLKRHEVSHPNLIKANDIIETLKQLIITDNDEIMLFSSFDGKEYLYSLSNAFAKLSLEPISKCDIISKFGEDKYDRLLLTRAIANDLKMFTEISLCEYLNHIVRSMFKDKKLIFVDEHRGYKPINKLDQIVCNRITTGRPRCKYLI